MKKIVFVTLVSMQAWGANEDVLLQQVISQRAQLELVAQQLGQEVNSFEQTRQTLETQRNELLASLQRDRVKLATLKEKKQSILKTVDSLRPQTTDNKQLIKDWIQELSTWVQNSLPFEKETRLQKVADLEKRLAEKEPLTPLLWDLWSLTEKEIGLTRGVSTTIEESSEVVRLGMLMMYDKAAESGYGLWTRTNGEWKRTLIQNESEKDAIDHLIQAAAQKSLQSVKTLPGLEMKEM